MTIAISKDPSYDASSSDAASGSKLQPSDDAATAVTTTVTSTTKEPRATTPAPGTTAQDQHPYARGSVIEVWHVNKKNSAEDWWSETSSEDELDQDENRQKTVRMCDVIDRAPVTESLKNTGTNLWRYYIHYKDFNRRMDEWVNMDRIVSPPSVGNAKARAMKKEEERLKRKQLRKEEAAAAEQEMMDWTAARSRRRASAVPSDLGPDSNGGEGGTRRTRLSRRKSSAIDDDATVIAGNQGDEDTAAEEEANAHQHAPTKKEAMSLPTDAVTTHQVGDHVVATVKAQELDEHEGLDEASLREHEEVTKVKNVGFIEIGQFQSETWYFSPIPKELLTAGGYIEVLYVCEFTLRLFARKTELRRFQSRLPTDQRHPPGNEIYRNGNLSMFEVDGLNEKIYCQNLCKSTLILWQTDWMPWFMRAQPTN
jgi:histone acetyltransferase MYST1